MGEMILELQERHHLNVHHLYQAYLRWEGGSWLQEPTARRVSRPVSRPRLLQTMQRKSPCCQLEKCRQLEQFFQNKIRLEDEKVPMMDPGKALPERV